MDMIILMKSMYLILINVSNHPLTLKFCVTLYYDNQMYPQVSGLPLPSVVLDLLLWLCSLSPALMSIELSCLEERKGNIYKEFLICTLLISTLWYNSNYENQH